MLHSILNQPDPCAQNATYNDSRNLRRSAGLQDSWSSARARAITDWDPSYQSDNRSEEIDWFSEYAGRHGQLSVGWLPKGDKAPELRGMAMMHRPRDEKIIAPTDSGSVSIWRFGDEGEPPEVEPLTSQPGILFPRSSPQGAQSSASFVERILEFGGDITECVSVSTSYNKAFFATSDVITEVDLNTFQTISQQKFAWAVTALSRETLPESSNTVAVGTRHSLHLHDSRHRGTHTTSNGVPEDQVAFIPNIGKPVQLGLPRLTHSTRSLTVMRTGDPGEPGPLSILPVDDTLFVAGRFPSILRYDRRFFPKLEDTIHSGGRLSGLAYMPYPANGVKQEGLKETLVACGEYGGRGSLELYSFPESTSSSKDFPIGQACQTKNRQTASSAKLLSVATQGTRIVFSDADGGLKWVERDGYSLVRRWNVNNFSFPEPVANVRLGNRILQAETEGTDVVRKIVPSYAPWQSDRGDRGDSPLLIWTGEKIGIVSNRSNDAHAAVASGEHTGLTGGGEEEEYLYETGMRRALQRQAEEVNWLQRFGYGR